MLPVYWEAGRSSVLNDGSQLIHQRRLDSDRVISKSANVNTETRKNEVVVTRNRLQRLLYT